MKYPVSTQLKAAIETLFESPAPALDCLGALEEVSARAGYQESMSPNLSPGERARRLRQKLEGYVENMAAEVAELGSDDETRRLRAESTGTLIALRELWLHFPEAFDSPQD